MSTNPLKKATTEGTPKDQAERRRFWIERGNRLLWGQEPTSKGDYLTPRLHLEWRWSKDSQYFITERSAPGERPDTGNYPTKPVE